jgi:hypothetical protein
LSKYFKTSKRTPLAENDCDTHQPFILDTLGHNQKTVGAFPTVGETDKPEIPEDCASNAPSDISELMEEIEAEIKAIRFSTRMVARSVRLLYLGTPQNLTVRLYIVICAEIEFCIKSTLPEEINMIHLQKRVIVKTNTRKFNENIREHSKKKFHYQSVLLEVKSARTRMSVAAGIRFVCSTGKN